MLLVRIYLCQVANGLYYNAPMCLTILQHLGVTSEIFQTWLQMLYAVKKSGKPLHFVRYRLILTRAQRWVCFVYCFLVCGLLTAELVLLRSGLHVVRFVRVRRLQT